MREAVCTQLLREWIARGEPAWLPLIGESMAPFLHSGSRVLVSKGTTGEVLCGDLLLFEVEGKLICHRVLRRRASGGKYAFLTKGDDWRTIEFWIGEEQVIGRVVSVERNGDLVRLDSFLRRLHAVGATAIALAAIGSRVALRRIQRLLKLQRTWARSS
jgi:signal peptidase I